MELIFQWKEMGNKRKRKNKKTIKLFRSEKKKNRIKLSVGKAESQLIHMNDSGMF